jgi:hypothetical protein
MLVLLMGCQPSNRLTDTDAAGKTSHTPVTGIASCTARSGYEVFPKEVEVPFPYHLRADRFFISAKGEARRRVVIEYLTGDIEKTSAAVDEALKRAGFRARARHVQPNQNIVVHYVKWGYGRLSVTISRTAGKSPSNPSAKGTVTLDYPANR